MTAALAPIVNAPKAAATSEAGKSCNIPGAKNGAAVYPVELLCDGRGIYGIGIAKETDVDDPPADLLLRPDRPIP